MIHIKHQVIIDRPLADVFDYAATFERHSQWMGEVVEAKPISQSSVNVGTQALSVGQFLGRRTESVLEVTAYNLNQTFAVKTVSGLMPFEMTLNFEQIEHRTTISVIGTAELRGLFRLAQPLVAQMAQKQWENNLANLKNVLEVQTEGS